MILWESLYVSFKGCVCCPSGQVGFGAASAAPAGAFAIVPPPNEGKGRLRRWEEGRCEGNEGHQRLSRGFVPADCRGQ